MSTSLAITGAGGRMGRRLLSLALEQPERFAVAAALESAQSPLLQQDIGGLAGTNPTGIMVSSVLTGQPQVMIDFSAPVATRQFIPLCVKHGINMVIGTTGLNAADQQLIDEAGKTIAIMQATNTSLGITLLLDVVAKVAQQLGDDYDIEIAETHHNLKKDAPSGTALSLAEAICRSTGKDLQRDVVHGREGPNCLRQRGQIGMHALRMGDVVGDHVVHFGTAGERLEFRHVASTRDTFVRGALKAAQFIAQARPGRYTMRDVLGL